MTKLEELARAMQFASLGKGLDRVDHYEDTEAEVAVCRGLVIAVLQALREPSEAMVAVGEEKACEDEDLIDIGEVFRSMIDAILAEKA